MKLYIAETWESHETAELVGIFDTSDAAIDATKTKMKDYGQVYWVELNESQTKSYQSVSDPNHTIIWARYPKGFSLGE